MLGHEGLLLLIRLKFVGGLRAQARRLKRPKNWLFLGIGIVLMFGWLSSLLFGGAWRRSAFTSGEWLVPGVQASLLVLCVLTVVGAFNHRGLYLPKEEIELCFSAPVTRSDLVRYRLFVNLLRSLVAALVFGLGAALRLPSGIYGFFGAFVTMLTVPILGQAVALLLGDAENKLGAISKKLPLGLLSRVLTIVVILGVLRLFLGTHALLDDTFTSGPDEGFSFTTLLENPVVRGVLLPFKPWALMITAESAQAFLPWFVFACAFGWIAFEATVRIPVDFRELSLETSADVAKRLNRLRRGSFSAGQSQASKATIGWRVPWLFGRGAFGAVAWLKTASIVRKARGTMTLSALVILFLTVMSVAIARGDDEKSLIGAAALICLTGTLYLCAGLRFDFRGDLDIMDAIKCWPLRPALLFLATILPETLLVSGLLVLAVLGRAAYAGRFHPTLLALIAFQPLFTLTWVALDNAVYLFSPVRYTPGQEGALQHMGRTMVLVLLRMLLLVLVLIVAVGPAVGIGFAVHEWFSASLEVALAIGAGVAWLGLFGVDAGLVLLGGEMLRRFDVARDKAV